MKIGDLVRFNHEQDGGPVHRIVSVMSDGMVEIHDIGGYFAPHLFAAADDVADIPPKLGGGMKLDPESRQKAIEAVSLALGGGTDDPTLWGLHIAVCERTVDVALDTYLAAETEKGKRMMPREPTNKMLLWYMSSIKRGEVHREEDAWIVMWDAHAAE